MIENTLFQVEEIEAISFDENGQEDGTWEGFAVTLIEDPSKHCFECRDQTNADQLCEFLNRNILSDDSIGAYVIDNLSEWSRLVTELSENEIALYEWKEVYSVKSEEIIKNTDFKELYGKNNADVRKAHVRNELRDWDNIIHDLEFSIDYLKRRISFLKQLVHTKTVLLEVKE